MATTDGKLTIIEVSKDNVTFEPVCVFNNEATVDYGTETANKEFCLSSELPFISMGDTEFTDQTYIMAWSEGFGNKADKIVHDAKVAPALADKKIYVRVTANNSKGANGTRYVAEFLVSGYKHTFKKGEINKTEFTVSQQTMPIETAAA